MISVHVTIFINTVLFILSDILIYADYDFFMKSPKRALNTIKVLRNLVDDYSKNCVMIFNLP